MNTTLVTVTCLLVGLTIPVASADGGVPVGARAGPISFCYEILGETLIKSGCVPPCLFLIKDLLCGESFDVGKDIEILALA